MTDPIEILVSAQAEALMRRGVPAIEAWVEAESAIEAVIQQLGRMKAPVGHYLRRIHVYQLRSRGITVTVVSRRLGISRTQVHHDYSNELERKRRHAA